MGILRPCLRSASISGFVLAAMLLPAAPAWSSGGGGGGGMGSMPSESAPQYDANVEYSKGIAAFQAKDWKTAATALGHVVAVAPKLAAAQYLLGASWLAAGDAKKARHPLELALKADPAMLDAQRDLAIAYARAGDAAKAASAREALTRRKAECAATCATAAAIDAALAAVDAAAGGQAQALGPTHPLRSLASVDATYVEAVAMINRHEYAPAIARLEDALWAAGPHPDLLTYLGFANRKLKRYDEARGWYETALRVAPQHRGALEYFGELKLELGDVAGARAHLARLDRLCGYGCQQADELRRWLREDDRSAS